MRQRHDDRALAEALADPVLEWARTKKALDRHLSDRDQDLRLEQSQLGVEPVRAVRDAGGRRPQVAGVALVAPGEASHQRRDVGHAAKLLGVAQPGAEHPAVELLAAAPDWRVGAASSPPESTMPSRPYPARSGRARTSFTRSPVTPPRSPGVSSRTPRKCSPSASATRSDSSASSLKVSTSTMRRTSS